MTFKHVKFEDSIVMRSLEKVAKDKGLVKSDPLHKTASKTLDITPTDNLTDNVLRLCAGLRAQGLVKHADEVETNYLNFKCAQTLYETSKEEGDDLVHAAHPKGSHKLDGVDSDEATFEDILDGHLKMVQVLEKKPTGKLSSAYYIKDVKTALGINNTLNQQLSKHIELASNLFNNIDKIIRNRGGLTVGLLRYFHMSEFLKNLFKKQPMTLDVISDSKNFVNKIYDVIEPGWSGGISTDVWSVIQPYKTLFSTYFDNATKVRSQMNALESGSMIEDEDAHGTAHDLETSKTITMPEIKMQSGPLSSLFYQIGEQLNRLNRWKAYAVVVKNPAAANWLSNQIKTLNEISSRYEPIDDSQETAAFPQMKKEVDEQIKDIDETAAALKIQ